MIFKNSENWIFEGENRFVSCKKKRRRSKFRMWIGIDSGNGWMEERRTDCLLPHTSQKVGMTGGILFHNILNVIRFKCLTKFFTCRKILKLMENENEIHAPIKNNFSRHFPWLFLFLFALWKFLFYFFVMSFEMKTIKTNKVKKSVSVFMCSTVRVCFEDPFSLFRWN